MCNIVVFSFFSPPKLLNAILANGLNELFLALTIYLNLEGIYSFRKGNNFDNCSI